MSALPNGDDIFDDIWDHAAVEIGLPANAAPNVWYHFRTALHSSIDENQSFKPPPTVGDWSSRTPTTTLNQKALAAPTG